MAPRRKRSRKRSAASSTAALRLERAVFYLDESIYSRTLVARLEARGANIKHAGAAFPFGTEDHVWLTACGERSWIVLTRDENIRRRVLEREAIRAANVGAFALTSGQATAAEAADVIERLLPKFVNMSVSEPKPFVYTFGLRGHLSKVSLNR